MGGMRFGIALALAVVLVAGCGGGDEPEGESLSVESFNERAAASTASWTRSLEPFAREFVRVRDRGGEGLRVSVETRDDGDEPEVVVTLDRLADDSVRAERYALSLERRHDGRLRLVSAHRTWRCWEGRGHQDFSTELCV
jgi:hypothetical protein